MKTHHAVAGLELCDSATCSNNSACEFMAEDLRRLNITLEDFLDVRAADAAGGYFDEDFVVADFGNGHFFDADDSLFAIDAGAHGFGDGAEGALHVY